ncbi:hypothetical protein L7F22_046139 [Adiantum nelumboides]|nr:hypothetical protein [Adiantum nelumboides]
MGNPAKDFLVDKGNVSFNPDYVDLTWFLSNPSLSTGRISNKNQLFLWDSATEEAASFNCSFKFSIVPMEGVSPADGLAFFLFDPNVSDTTQASKGGGLGLPATTNNTIAAGVVAVEFDTFRNLQVQDPNDNHIGIDISSVDSAVSANLSFELTESPFVFCWVDYSSSMSLLEVYATNLSSTKPTSPVLSYIINLAQFLPEYVTIGFSAATGALAEYNRIYSWSFNSTSIGISAPAPAPEAPQSALPRPEVPPPVDEKGANVSLIAGLISAGTLVCVVVLGLCLCQKRRRRRRRRSLDDRLPSGIDLSGLPSSSDVGLGPHKFYYRDLSLATNNFGEDCLLGEGGFGSVYKGLLPDNGSEVAVKRISQKSSQGEKEFFAEVSIISRIRHKNLVQLKGWCRDKSNLLLVYEYLSKGSLDRFLFSKASSLILDWSKRYNIVCGLGSALQYLHHGCEKVIVHRDIKASNVMLDANYNAKLGDFGLARQLGEGMEGHTTHAAGTVGYMAPEIYGTGRATTMSDVYSYGMVLLEVVCGRRPVDANVPGKFEGCLLDWVWDLHSKGELREACDGRLQGEFDEEQLDRTLMVGLACLHPDPKERPSMQVALETLQGRVPLPLIPTFKPVAYYGPPPPMSLWSINSSTISTFSHPISTSSSAPDTDMSEKALLRR